MIGGSGSMAGGEYDIRLNNLENHVNQLGIQIGSIGASVHDQGKRIEKILDMLTKEKPPVNWGWMVGALGLLGMLITLYTQPIIAINERQTGRIDEVEDRIHELAVADATHAAQIEELKSLLEDVDKYGSRRWLFANPPAVLP